MATQEQLEAGFTALNDATNEVAAEIEELSGMVANAGLPATVEDEFVNRLHAAAARLKGLAADPENPVPEQPPVEEQPAGEGIGEGTGQPTE